MKGYLIWEIWIPIDERTLPVPQMLCLDSEIATSYEQPHLPATTNIQHMFCRMFQVINNINRHTRSYLRSYINVAVSHSRVHLLFWQHFLATCHSNSSGLCRKTAAFVCCTYLFPTGPCIPCSLLKLSCSPPIAFLQLSCSFAAAVEGAEFPMQMAILMRP